jgi:hypothetical protein
MDYSQVFSRPVIYEMGRQAAREVLSERLDFIAGML